MAQERILFAHELSSSGQSRLVGWLRKALPTYQLIAPDLPLAPREAIALLTRLIEQESPRLLVGVSMGGMLAQLVEAPQKLLINPAFSITAVLQKHIGRWPWSWPRRDGETHFVIDEALIETYRQIEMGQFLHHTPHAIAHTHALFAEDDVVVPEAQALYQAHYLHSNTYAGGHFVTEEEVKAVIAPAIERLLEDGGKQ